MIFDKKNKVMSFAKIEFIIIMFVFGTIGVVTHYIPMRSATIVCYRAILAAIFLISISFIIKRKFDINGIKKNINRLIILGIFLGINWVFQFEAFKLATVSVGTVCYNTMPIFVILISPILFKDKITKKNVLCIAIAMIGVLFVSNLFLSNERSHELLSGILYGILAGLFYALTVCLNKTINMESYDKVTVEFIVSSIIMIPYIIFFQKGEFWFSINASSSQIIIGLVLIIVLGFVHTGLSYIFYFSAVDKLKASDVAILTYIDPVFSVLLSFMIIGESMNIYQIIGAVLILISTIINEFVNLEDRK